MLSVSLLWPMNTTHNETGFWISLHLFIYLFIYFLRVLLRGESHYEEGQICSWFFSAHENDVRTMHIRIIQRHKKTVLAAFNPKLFISFSGPLYNQLGSTDVTQMRKVMTMCSWLKPRLFRCRSIHLSRFCSFVMAGIMCWQSGKASKSTRRQGNN